MLKIRVMLVVLFFVCLAASGFPAEKPGALPGVKEAPRPAETDDPLGRSSPKGTVYGFIKSASQKEYEQALQYLDTKKKVRARRNLWMPCSSFWIVVFPESWPR